VLNLGEFMEALSKGSVSRGKRTGENMAGWLMAVVLRAMLVVRVQVLGRG
jgi:hypothetical protein